MTSNTANRQAILKLQLIERARLRAAYACNGRAKAFNMPISGWNAPSDDGLRWIEKLSSAGLRFVDYSDKIVRLNHTGWYTEDDGSNGETLRGVVLQLPGRNGRAQYLAAYEDPNLAGAYRVDIASGIFRADKDRWQGYPDSNDAMRDAARAADSFAEQQAQEQRDYNRAWREGSNYSNLGETIAAHRKDALALIREMKATRKAWDNPAGDIPTICTTLRAHIRKHIADIAKAREQRAELLGNVWRKYRDAFNDGAGETVA